MTYIILSILCSTGILIVFKLGDRIGANTRHIIVVGYLVSALSGSIIFSVTPLDVPWPWHLIAVIEGTAFYAVFRLMAISAQSSGISITGIASKMSVVIPLVIGIVWLGETVNLLIASGVVCGLLAIWLTVGKRENVVGWYWPLLVFMGTGLVDASFKLFQVYGLSGADTPAFLVTVFFFASVSGLLHHMTYSDRLINRRSMLAGMVLGLINLGSAYFLMMALAIPSMASIFVYSVINFGVVVLAVLLALTVFREPIDGKGRVGLAVAVASIALLYVGHTG